MPAYYVRRWISSKENLCKINKVCSRRSIIKGPAHRDIEEAVLDRLSVLRRERIPISGISLRTFALGVAEKLGKPQFKASAKWLQGFLKRNLASLRRFSGERASANAKAADVRCRL